MKKLPFTAIYLAAAICVAVVMTTHSASAQCTYRMNDVGRSHGYLSGPCNGSAQNYNGAYRSRPSGVVGSRNPKGMIIRAGNFVRVYDSSGRLLGQGIKRGDVLNMHVVGRRSLKISYSTRRIYDERGRVVGIADPGNLR
jgi:hypothetical protein